MKTLGKTCVGIEIELVRRDWQQANWQPATNIWCRCAGRICKRKCSLDITLPEGWRLEGDCSIPPPPYGVELVSPKLYIEDMRKQLPRAILAMREAGYIEAPHEFGGIHISVSMDGRLGSKIKEKLEQGWTTDIRDLLMSDPISRLHEPSVHWSPGIGRHKGYCVNMEEWKGRMEFRMMGSSLDVEKVQHAITTVLSTGRL